ncbi:MAG TPA: tyrosinase family protein [Polyangiaceae bacterium]|nr:tyrosinase family protein [Polyangiaceae bacterium]
MAIELSINNTASARGRYVTWAPSPCILRATPPFTPPLPATLRVRNRPGTGIRVAFRRTATSAPQSSLTLTLSPGAAAVSFFVSGVFPRASTADGDVAIQVLSGAAVLLDVRLMVRIRKNANRLTPQERDRFLAALAALNNRGAGRFLDFRNMHTEAGSPEAHGAPGFLPWHRAYLLDLERELQAIDSSVSLPYWRFDQPAPNLFTPEFMGTSDRLGTVGFSAMNPLQFWRTDGVPGINRRPRFDTRSQAALVINEAATLALGTNYSAFRSMEGNPHGFAHTSFGGFISSIPTAARDPLFFLLHANVDRLWAKWQRTNNRFNPGQLAAFAPATGSRVGHNVDDTMWPWNGVTTAPRPSTAPGGALAPSPTAVAPGGSPRVRDCLDYQGRLASASRMGFDYDDVNYL